MYDIILQTYIDFVLSRIYIYTKVPHVYSVFFLLRSQHVAMTTCASVICIIYIIIYVI